MVSRIFALIKAVQPASGIFLATITSLTGYVLRYSFIEPDVNGAICEVNGPWWCPPRTALIVATEWKIIGGLALALALVAVLMVLRDGRQMEKVAMAAMAIGGAGLLLYNATLAAVAVVLAGLVLAKNC
ncbi:conserved membrane hypothetical protein [Gammaproteobacteria bacterium]